MGESGGTAELTVECRRDGTPTRLRCAECQAPICPACFVRTPVGLRCPDCSAASGPPVREEAARPRWLVPALVAVLVALGLAGAARLGRRGGEEPALDPSDWSQSRGVTERVRIGTGTLPMGAWILEARRGEGVCATLTVLPGPSGQERCHQPPGNRHVAFTSTSRMTTASETVYLTLGLVSERTERVRVAPEGAASWEVPALGAGVDLGGRFFVALTSNPVTTFTALAADGTELGRIRSAPPGT